MQNWDAALDDLTRLKDIIDANTFAPLLQQLQQRTWLMHWALFVFFNHDNGRNAIIDLFFQDKCAAAWRQHAACQGCRPWSLASLCLHAHAACSDCNLATGVHPVWACQQRHWPSATLYVTLNRCLHRLLGCLLIMRAPDK